jgi:hypothetical protein
MFVAGSTGLSFVRLTAIKVGGLTNPENLKLVQSP